MIRITEKIDGLLQQKDQVVVAIDGSCTAGKTTLADRLAKEYDCNVIRMDDFFLRPEQRTQARLAETGGNVDYERFREEVLENLRTGCAFSYRPYDCGTGSLKDPVQVQPKGLTIVEGTYAHHPYFGDAYDLRIYLRVSEALRQQRILLRPAFLHKRFFDEWIPMEQQYFKAFSIGEKSHLNLDLNEEWEQQTKGGEEMTREEIYQALYSHEEVYRPPLEMNSAMLELTYGCSYGRCTFCDFTRDKFQIIPLQEVEYKSRLLSLVIDGNPSLHLLGCNPLCLPMEYLMQVLGIIRQNLPCVQRINMYARADDVLLKGEGAMAQLRAAGLTELHVGVESGSDLVLQLHNKGESVQMLKDAFRILEKCGIAYHMTLIPGLGGAEHSREHCIKTAQLLSTLHPVSIWCMALKIWPNTRLQHMVKTGDFYPMNYREILLEEREMIERTQFQSSCLYVDSTVLGEYTVMGFLPEAKEELLGQIDSLLNLQT